MALRPFTYMGWEISEAHMGFVASHPSFDGAPDANDDRCVHGDTLDDLYAEVTRMIEEDPDRCAVPLTVASVFSDIAQAFGRMA